ncbi:hypothetical protein M9H77_35823 [Catharanthus roseus]|uniref:Uncharacterized protein n=1 Tax=Catharanthus roseus TaxID=4058 RepID=A0ACB9ZQF4_CATRO|nr:hypothetical protein M9H77_35823 [Catharanthus roseus]
MRKFLPENGLIARTSNWSRFGSPGLATGLGKQLPGLASYTQGDTNLGPMTDRTGRVEGRAVTAPSRSVKGRPSTSNIPSTPAPFGPSIYYDPGVPASSTQSLPISFRTRPPTTSHHPYTPISYDPYGWHASCVDTKDLSGRWSLLEAWIYLYFLMFAPSVRPGAKLCKPYIQWYAMLGHKSEHKLIGLCTDDYMRWFLPCTYPRIQNPERLPCSMQLLMATPITLQVLVDMISCEVDRDDVDDAMKIGRISDMIKKYNQPRR